MDKKDNYSLVKHPYLNRYYLVYKKRVYLKYTCTQANRKNLQDLSSKLSDKKKEKTISLDIENWNIFYLSASN